MPTVSGTGPETQTGSDGADVLNGSASSDVLNGAGGADVLRGLGGADTLNGGEGADRFFWTAGDGSDVVEGGTGVDTHFFDRGGSHVVSASGGHALVRIGADTVDLHGVEVLNLQSATGQASFDIRDLSATEVQQVVIQLDPADATQNTIGLTGAATADVITVQALSASGLRVLDTADGKLATTVISNLESRDRFTVNGGNGADAITITTPGGVASAALLTARGGEGADSITGSTGAEVLTGDGGDDAIDGGGGTDIIDGGAGLDTQTLTGGGEGDLITVSASGNHVREGLNGVTLDLVNVETINIRTLGQADTVQIGDLSFTDVRTVNLDLGADDGQADKVFLTAPSGGEVRFTSSADGANLQATYVRSGTPVQTVNVSGIGATDVINLAGGAGNDVFSTTAAARRAQVVVDGGGGINRQDFTGTTGDDLITLVANGELAKLTHNGEEKVLLNNFGQVTILTLDGLDRVRIGDLRGTDVREVLVDLNGANGRTDGQSDVVTMEFATTGTLQLQDSRANFSFKVVDAATGLAQSGRVRGMDVSDQLLVNLSSDSGLYALKDVAPGDATFRFSAGDDIIDWELNLVQQEGGRVEGGGGADEIRFSLSELEHARDVESWAISLNSNGSSDVLRLRHEEIASNDQLPLTLDSLFLLADVAQLALKGGKGADNFAMELNGTHVAVVNIDVGGGVIGDGKRDQVEFSGTGNDDVLTVTTRDTTGVDVDMSNTTASTGAKYAIRMTSLDTADRMIVHAGGGNDLIDLRVFFNRFNGQLVVDGGAGADTTLLSDLGNAAVIFDFRAGGGQDIVVGFGGLAGTRHQVDVSSTNDHSVADMIAHNHLAQVGGDLVIRNDLGDSLILKGFAPPVLNDVSFFIFGS